MNVFFQKCIALFVKKKDKLIPFTRFKWAYGKLHLSCAQRGVVLKQTEQ